MGTFFSDHSEPDKITSIKDDFNELDEPTYKNFLHVKVSPAAAVEFQHYKDTIIEKINAFFGYKAIVDLRLQQNFIPKKTNLNIKKTNEINKVDINVIPKAKMTISSKFMLIILLLFTQKIPIRTLCLFY